MAAADAEDDDVPCAYCSRQRALLHCAQHGARLCLPCDLRLHAAAAAPGRGHERAPLCDRCHAAPAAARCVDHRHQALLCAPCASAASCDADGHATRPAQAYTGCPGPAELARILSWDAAAAPPPAPEPPDTWVPDLVNIELLPDLLPSSSSSWHDGNITSEVHIFLLSRSLMETGGNFEGPVAGSSGASLPTGDGDDELFIDEDWPNLDDAGLDDFNFILDDSNNLTMNTINLTDQREGTFKPQASTSLGYDHPLIASCSEPIIAASIDAVLESLASNNAAYHQFSSVATANMSGNVSSELLPHGNTFYASGMAPTMLPGDEFPSTNFGFEVKPPALVAAVSSPIGSYQDQEAALLVLSAHEQQASSHDMEARTKQQEKRQEAKQRYKDKKKNRRFGKQIMYVSRKVRADTRNRVKGRFAKASSGNDIQADDQSTQHGDDQPTN